jgi:hypothetical protein
VLKGDDDLLDGPQQICWLVRRSLIPVFSHSCRSRLEPYR